MSLYLALDSLTNQTLYTEQKLIREVSADSSKILSALSAQASLTLQFRDYESSCIFLDF